MEWDKKEVCVISFGWHPTCSIGLPALSQNIYSERSRWGKCKSNENASAVRWWRSASSEENALVCHLCLSRFLVTWGCLSSLRIWLPALTGLDGCVFRKYTVSSKNDPWDIFLTLFSGAPLRLRFLMPRILVYLRSHYKITCRLKSRL